MCKSRLSLYLSRLWPVNHAVNRLWANHRILDALLVNRQFLKLQGTYIPCLNEKLSLTATIQLFNRSAPRVSNSPPAVNNLSSDPSQILRVIAEAIQNVAQAQSQSGVTLHGNTAQIQRQVDLAKQQQVLVATAQALSVGMLDTQNSEVLPAISTLAHAARDVVNEVARHIVLERAARMPETLSASNTGLAQPSQSLSIKEVAVGLQTSVAQAVHHSDAMSSELEVLMNACALVKQQGQMGVPTAPPASMAPSVISSDFELPVLLRSQSSGPMINAIPTNAGVRLENIIMPAPPQELSLGQTQVPPS
jgi:hypothetical protein